MLGRVFLKSADRKWSNVVKEHEGFHLSALQKSGGIVMWCIDDDFSSSSSSWLTPGLTALMMIRTIILSFFFFYAYASVCVTSNA